MKLTLEKLRDISSFKKENFDRFLQRKKDQSSEDQRFEAGILIEEISTVNTDKAFYILHNKINRKSKLLQFYSQFGKVAAILILPLLMVTIWSLSRTSHIGTNQLSYREISNPLGVRSKIVLPDSSTVWLNAGSTIKYSVPFVRETRELELIGEAFLDVAKNPQSPLDVKFDQYTVRVLGTQFDVKAFPDDHHIRVVLQEGSIQLSSSRWNPSRESIILKPDQQWLLNKVDHSASLKNVDAQKLTSWHRNVLIFDNTPMLEVANQIERWYGVNVELVDKELYKYKFTTTFDNEPLYVVLELLEMSSPIKIKYIPGKINPATGSAEKSIVQINVK